MYFKFTHSLSVLSTYSKQLILLLFIGLLMVLCVPQVDAAGTVVVSPTQMNGWGAYEESSNGAVSFINGPAGSLGTGSAQLTIDGTGRMLLGTPAYGGTLLSALTQLNYSTYRISGDASLTPTLQFDIDYDATDGDNSWQGRLVFEPYLTGTSPTTGSWDTWNALLAGQSGWWASGSPGDLECTQALPCTWAKVLTEFPNARIRPNGFINFKVGGEWASGFTGSVDNFIIGVGTDITTYDFEPCTVGTVTNTDTGDTFCSIQAAIDAGNTDDTIVVPAGNFNEKVNVSKALTLLGANAGVAGNGSRGAESVIVYGAETTAVTIAANNVTLDGFNLLGATGVSLGNQSGTVIQNNLIQTYAVGVQVQTNGNPFTIQNNAITLPQLAGSQPTIGVFLNGLSGATAPTIQDNVVTGSFYGYLLHAVNTTAPTTINGGTISGVMQGISVVNSVDGTNYYPSSFAADGVIMSGFTGDYSAVPALAPYNFHAGVYIFTGVGSSAITSVSGTLANLDIQGTGKISPDSAGLYFGDFSTAGSTMQNISVDSTTISNNLNRGVFARGQNAVVLVQNSTITDNGLDPHVTGGNYGYSVIARNSATITIEDSTITNPTSQTNSVSYRFHASTSSNLVVRGNQVSNGTIFQLASGTNLLAYANNITNFTDANLPGAGTINARHNWWGTYASQPTGVDNDSWAFLLGSPVSTWADGTGTVTLADGIASDSASFTGAGDLVIVNHGSGLANVPFGKGIPADTGAAQCADFYDFFAIGGSGTYAVSIPVEATTCTITDIDNKLFEFALNGGGAPDLTCNPDTACWNSIAATRAGDVLTSNVAAADLQGTPFAAPSVNNNDPTAVSLATFSASTNAMGMVTAVILILLTLTTFVLWKRRDA